MTAPTSQRQFQAVIRSAAVGMVIAARGDAVSDCKGEPPRFCEILGTPPRISCN